MESLNRTAVELVDEAIDFADELGIAVHHLANDAVVLDFGVEASGGIEAGLLLAEIATGGLATVDPRLGEIGDAPVPHVDLHTDHPTLALLAAQRSGWPLDVGGFRGRGSGPAQLRLGTAGELGLAYQEDFDLGVLAVEATALPDGAVAEAVADACELPTSAVYLPTAPVASVAGSVAMAARAAELAMVRLEHLGVDPTTVRSASASAPVAPVAGDEEAAMGRTNDALAYGGRVHLLLLEAAVDRATVVPFSETPAAGRRFEVVLREAGFDLEAVDPDVFAPAQATLATIGGPTRVVGGVDVDALAASFGL